jgi:light-regulated signal transduction histidine kinase (bacteriophytochrome)
LAPRNPTENDRSISDRDLSEILLRACHDLRSSVRAIRAHTELLRKDSPAPGTVDFERSFEFIVDGARKIESLADGLSSYSLALKIEEGAFQFTRMDAVLRTAQARLAKDLRDGDAEVTSGELPGVSGNPDRLAQVFEILLRNALRPAAQGSPRIHITAERRAEEWLFAVRDSGPGIDASPVEYENAGLGLAISRAIVERHGGKLWVESKTGKSSTFFFTLPALSE